MSKFTIMKDSDGQDIDLADLETQYEIATGRILIGVDKRDKDESMKDGGGMVNVIIKREKQERLKMPGSKNKKPMYKIDDGRETADYQRGWAQDIEYKTLWHNSKVRSSETLHKLLFIDAETEILEALSKYATERTESEINGLPAKYKNCPNMGIFIRYDISKLKQKAKLEEAKIISLACILLMNFYNQMRDHERKIAEGKSLSIANSFWLGRLLGRIIALDFEHRIRAGINSQIGTKTTGKIHAEKTKKSDPAGMKAVIDKYFKDNTTPSYKPSFTTAAEACAKSFNCDVKTVRNSVTNTYTNRK